MAKKRSTEGGQMMTCRSCLYFNFADRYGLLPGWGVCRKWGETAVPVGGCIWGKTKGAAP